VGEFGLIEAVVARLPAGGAVLLGPGDDAAVVAAPDGRVVATTDVLVEGVHFRGEWTTPTDLGRRAAAANLADVAAMGATPTALLVGLGLPEGTAIGWVLALMDGLAAEAGLVGAGVAGGDVVAAPLVVVSVTALGDLHGAAPVTRGGAQPGDVVAIAGRLGWAAAGLALRRAQDSGAGGDLEGQPWARRLFEAYARPVVRYEQGPAAAAAGAHALCDVSDGLLADLGHLARASGVGVVLDVPRLGRHVSGELARAGQAVGVDPLGWVLAGGEDHAFVGCFPPTVPLPAPWEVVGSVREGPPGQVLAPGWAGTATGWDHFRGPR
jgi:thiamine-monophosphate kinase